MDQEAHPLTPTPVYRFVGTPPLDPFVYFDEDGLISLVIWGWVGAAVFARPYEYSVAPGPKLGEFEIEGDDFPEFERSEHGIIIGHKELADIREEIKAVLPGAILRYHGEVGTDRTWVWVITDMTRSGRTGLVRLGKFPD